MTTENHNKAIKLISKQILSYNDLQELKKIEGVTAKLLNTLLLSQYSIQINNNTYYVYVDLRKQEDN